MSMFGRMIRGVGGFGRGLRWLRRHPSQLLLLFVPMILSIAAVIAGWGFFWSTQEAFFEWALFAKPDGYLMLAVYYLAKAFLYVGVVVVGFLGFVLLVSVVSSPIYDYVSMAIERDLTGRASELSLIESLKLMGEEIKKVLFILFLSVAILFIPVVNILAPLFTAFFVGWDMYDYTLARRGFSFRQRWQMVRGNLSSVLGIGIWLIIPGLQMILMPLSVAGATILAIEDLQQSDEHGSSS